MSMNAKGTDGRRPLELPLRFRLSSGQACVIRMAVEDDAEQLCELVPKYDAETDLLNRFPGEFDLTVEQERAFIRANTETPAGIFLVAEVDGRIIAGGGAPAEKLKRFVHRREFGLAVLREFWRQGVGRRLTIAVIDWARREGLRKLSLRVFHRNHAAIALYKSCGFIEEGRLTGDALLADGSYGDTILMAKFLRQPSAEDDGQATP